MNLSGRAGIRALLPWLAIAAVVIGLLNFIWFFAESATIGDTQRGYVLEGRYFLVHAGRATEVSREAWEWSRIHGLSVLITHPLAMAGMAYFLLRSAFPAMMGRRNGRADDPRASAIEAGGDPLASGRYAGQIGDLRFSGPLVGVSVHAGGVVFRPLFMKPVGIAREEIRNVEFEKRRFGSFRLRIEHAGSSVPSPIWLYVRPGDPVAEQVRALMIPGVHPLALPEGPTRRPPWPREVRVMIIVGVALSLVFLVVIGFGPARPPGAFGAVWTLVLIGIVGYNLWYFFIRDRDRWR